MLARCNPGACIRERTSCCEGDMRHNVVRMTRHLRTKTATGATNLMPSRKKRVLISSILRTNLRLVVLVSLAAIVGVGGYRIYQSATPLPPIVADPGSISLLVSAAHVSVNFGTFYCDQLGPDPYAQGFEAEPIDPKESISACPLWLQTRTVPKEGRKTTLWVQWSTNVPRISPTILILLSGGSRLTSFTSRAFNGPEVDVTKQDLTLGTTPTQALILRPRRSSGVNGVRISGERQSPIAATSGPLTQVIAPSLAPMGSGPADVFLFNDQPTKIGGIAPWHSPQHYNTFVSVSRMSPTSYLEYQNPPVWGRQSPSIYWAAEDAYKSTYEGPDEVVVHERAVDATLAKRTFGAALIGGIWGALLIEILLLVIREPAHRSSSPPRARNVRRVAGMRRRAPMD
jgi:hypothetical protein